MRKFNCIKIENEEHLNECYKKIIDLKTHYPYNTFVDRFIMIKGYCIGFEIEEIEEGRLILTFLTDNDLQRFDESNELAFNCNYFNDIDSFVEYHKIYFDCRSLGVL